MEERENVKVVLFGAPAAGKGTQAKILAEKLKVPHVASGDLFREQQQKDTPLGRQVRLYMERGVLVPDEVTIKMVLERLSQPDCKSGFVLDGFPRTIEQAKSLDKALADRNASIDVVVNLKVTEEELLRRISGRLVCRNCQSSFHRSFSPPKVANKCDKCGGELYQRDDDTPQAAKRRLMVYEEVTSPVLKYYTDSKKLKNVEDADIAIRKVAKAIEEVLHLS